MKRNEDSLRDLRYNIKRTSIQIIGIPDEKQKAAEKNLKREQSKNFLTWERKQPPRSTKQSPTQDKPKEKHNKTYINQNNKS